MRHREQRPEPVARPLAYDEVYPPADYWLPALRGEVWTEGALLHVASCRWVLEQRTARGFGSPPEVVEALAEGDRRHVCDPRRYLNLDTWTVDVGHDVETEALLDLRAAAGDPVALADAIAAALDAGLSREAVQRTLVEVCGAV